MKKNKPIEAKKKFDAIQFVRRQRDRITEEISTMSNEEIIQYFNQQTKSNVKPSS